MTALAPQTTTRAPQTAAAVMMVRPASFGWNPETADSNRFQASAPGGDASAAAAVAEFDAVATALAEAGVSVQAFEDRAVPACPDAVFPNNWVSLHADGTVVLYPMLAPNRRRERRLDLLFELERRGGYRVDRLLDLTHHELRGHFLEGTGSVVFDHVGRAAYACRSPRTHVEVLEDLCAEIGYAPVAFDAVDATGVPVYHTNVMLSIGTGYALVCAAAVPVQQREALLERLSASGRRVVGIDPAQMAAFAGNVLELRGAGGTRVLAGSCRAFDGLMPAQLEALSACVDTLVAVPVPTLERLGGGSVRCMLAEIFLPQPAHAGTSESDGGIT